MQVWKALTPVFKWFSNTFFLIFLFVVMIWREIENENSTETLDKKKITTLNSGIVNFPSSPFTGHGLMDTSNFLSNCKFDTFYVLATFYLVGSLCLMGIWNSPMQTSRYKICMVHLYVT